MAVFKPYTGNYGFGSTTPSGPITQPYQPLGTPGGMRNIYGETINDADVTARDDQRFDWNDIGVGGYSALDELLMGIPTWLVKNVGGGEAYKNLQNWRQQNKMASDIGQTLGFGAGFLIPGGAVAKGAGKVLGAGSKLLGAGKLAGKLGKGAEALSTLGTVLSKGKEAGDIFRRVGDIEKAKRALDVATATEKLGKMGSLGKLLASGGRVGAAARGAAEAAESAIPWAITDTRQPEDIGQRAAGALSGILTGGALGGLLSRGAKARPSGGKPLTGNLLGRTAEQAGEALDRAQLGAMGFTDQSLRKYARAQWGKRAMGATVSQMDDVVRDVAEKAQKYGLTSENLWKKFTESTIGDYKRIGEQMEKAGYKVGDLIGDVKGRSENVATYIAKHGEEGAKELADLEKRLLSEKNTAGALEELNKTDKWWSSENRAKADLAELTDDYRDAIRAPMDEIAGSMDIDPNELRERYALTRFAQPMLAREGTSISKLAGGSPTMEKALIGAAIGGGGSALFGGGDTEDPDYWAKKLQQIAVGSIGGGLTNKILPGIYNKAVGKMAAGARKVLTPEVVAKAEQLGERLAGRGGDIAEFARGPILETVADYAPRLAGRIPELATAARGTAEGIEGPVPTQAEAIAKEQTNLQYGDILRDRLERYYAAYFADRMSFDEFVNQVGAKTNNFDPRMTAGILFPNKAEREQYLANFENLKRAQEMRERMPGVFNYASKGGGFMGMGGASLQDRKDYEDLINTVALIESGKSGLPSNAARKVIEDNLQIIFRQNVSNEEKQAMLDDLLESQLGVPLSLYKQAGIYG